MNRIDFTSPATTASNAAPHFLSPLAFRNRRTVLRILKRSILARIAFVAMFGAATVAQATPIGGLVQTFLQSPPTNFARFGEGIAAAGNDVVVGGEDAHAADVFSDSTGAVLVTIPSPTPKASDGFGFSAAATSANVFIGAPDDSSIATNAGIVYEYNPANGSLVQTFRAPTPTAFTEFGFSLATSGTKLLVGGLGTGSPPVYLYDTTTGNRLLTLSDPVQNTTDNFGGSIAFVGNNILVGASANQNGSGRSGVVYLFNGSTGSLMHTFQDPNTGGANWFGLSVAAVNGNILIGAPRDSADGQFSGAAYLFSGTTDALLHTYFDPNGPGLEFGTSVASVGSDALIGANNYTSSSDDEGAFYGFSPTSQLLWTTTNPDGSSESDFGFNVATLGNEFFAGAPLDGPAALDGGVAYEFQGPPVPEPSSLMLLAIGGLSLSGIACRRTRTAFIALRH
jgi:hypothetical protein